MTEEEFAKEFGGRPHQQRQSPVSMTDLKRFNVPNNRWDHCSHKFIPMNLCMRAHGGYMAHRFYDPYCKHAMHEFEMCGTAEFVRQNQVLGIKKKIHLAYSNQDRNWLYNDPNWGHMLWRTKHSAYSFKAAMMLGGSTRVYFLRCHHCVHTTEQNATHPNAPTTPHRRTTLPRTSFRSRTTLATTPTSSGLNPTRPSCGTRPPPPPLLPSSSSGMLPATCAAPVVCTRNSCTHVFLQHRNKTGHQTAEHGTHHHAPEMVQVFDPTLVCCAVVHVSAPPPPSFHPPRLSAHTEQGNAALVGRTHERRAARKSVVSAGAGCRELSVTLGGAWWVGTFRTSGLLAKKQKKTKQKQTRRRRRRRNPLYTFPKHLGRRQNQKKYTTEEEGFSCS